MAVAAGLGGPVPSTVVSMIAALGEALIDLHADPDGTTFRAHPGGSPMNVAVALARLGVPARMLARINHEDLFGPMLLAHMTAAGVDVRHLIHAHEPTGLAAVGIDADGKARYSFSLSGTADQMWAPDELPDSLPDDVTALHTGSLGAALEPGATEVAALLDREHARGRTTLSYDPNVRPALLGDRAVERARAERIVRLVDVVKASDEDVEWLYPDLRPQEVARHWFGLGAAIAVITEGSAGAFAVTGAGELQVPAPPIALVDTVGAGDTFMAGLLAGLAEIEVLGAAGEIRPRQRLSELDGDSLLAVLRLAISAAALVCTREGADPPTRADVRAFGSEDREALGSA